MRYLDLSSIQEILVGLPKNSKDLSFGHCRRIEWRVCIDRKHRMSCNSRSSTPILVQKFELYTRKSPEYFMMVVSDYENPLEFFEAHFPVFTLPLAIWRFLYLR